MSVSTQTTALSVPQIGARKGKAPLVCLTAYVGMVLHGFPSTLSVTLAMMILHGMAVRRWLNRALLVVDMRFRSCEESPELTFRNAARLIAKTGCPAVKVANRRPCHPGVERPSFRAIKVTAAAVSSTTECEES
ncbi:3-methyl-2-oxobutanoate hydroxymethyltransferase [Ensifer sp. IC3342]|nr:3-methyl-2-oxobutanoate hydroxymethyltransferase [Ensifer sp. BRP08]MCA1451146.1 3-methyl-2-oxobutanoate hydroxymethyltransferase [Ensifer sp. IC3342]